MMQSVSPLCTFSVVVQDRVADLHVEINYLKLQYYYRCMYLPCIVFYSILKCGVSCLSDNLLNSFTWDSSVNI